MYHKLLLVEDDSDLQESIKSFLVDAGFLVDTAGTGAKAIKSALEKPPDVVILDLGLPDMSGETVFREIKKAIPEIPIIFLTAQNTSSDMVKGLELGADDYIAKPFDEQVLIARINARIRPETNSSIVKIKDLVLDRNKVKVTREGREIMLTQREFMLLEFLIQNKGRVLSRELLLNRVWGYSSDVNSRSVDVYIGYLRKKIDKGFKTQLIHSIRGFGYLIKND